MVLTPTGAFRHEHLYPTPIPRPNPRRRRRRNLGPTVALLLAMLVELYSQVGAYIHNKLESAAWDDGAVEQLAEHLKTTQPGLLLLSAGPRQFERIEQAFEIGQICG